MRATYPALPAKTTMMCIASYRAAIGAWHSFCHYKLLKCLRKLSVVLTHCFIVGRLFMLKLVAGLTLRSFSSNAVYVCMLLLMCGDVHPNPGPPEMNTNQLLSICHMNVNSLYVRTDQNPSYKIDEIYSTYCVDKNCDIICISETWLNDTIPNCNIELPGYNIYRRDRADGYGGVMVYVSNSLIVHEIIEMRSNTVENIWLMVKLGPKIMLVAVFYRPPNADPNHVTDFLEDFQAQLQNAYAFKPTCIFLTGDFNDRRHSWSVEHSNSDLKNAFIDVLKANDLCQMVNTPTHFTERSQPTLLDLFITDSPVLVQHCSVEPPIGLCHHCPIYATLNIALEKNKSYKRHIWLYKKADFNSLNDYILDLPWGIILSTDSGVDDNLNMFNKVFTDICSHFIPNKMVHVRPRDKPWMTGQIRRLLRKRNRYHKQFKLTGSMRFRELWRSARSLAKYEIRNQKKAYYSSLATNLSDPNTSSKSFWKITKSLLGYSKNNDIPILNDDQGNSYVSPTEKANHLGEYFASQSTLSINNIPNLPPQYYVTTARLSNIIIRPEVVYKILCSLHSDKASGPDGVSNTVLKACALSISEPLSIIFQQSLDSGIFPKTWKDAHISALYKSIDKHIRTNYRPISLLSCLSKCLERCVFLELYKYCVQNNLLTWRNSGFKHMDSTIYQLISLVHTIYENLDKGKSITMVFLDISKAFDRVWHKGLLFKLKSFGINANLLLWFESYLTGRRQRVLINGEASAWFYINAGVPQGSILGPLLFLIFVNDIVLCVNSEIRLFADDTYLFDMAKDIEPSIAKLNSDLESLNTWSSNWRVSFNPSKTVYMHVNRRAKNTDHSPLYFNRSILKRVNHHKHLGIVLNDKLNWGDHITYIIDKVSTRLNAMRRLQYIVPRTCLESVYKYMLRPIIDYGDVLCPILPAYQTKQLEAVQRQAALICTKAYQRTPHVLLLKELGWEELVCRRKYHCLVVMYKIQHLLTPEYLSCICPPRSSNVVAYSLRNENNIRLFYCKSSTFRKSFFPETVKTWNALELTIRESTSLNIFKRKLKEVLIPKQDKLLSMFDGKSAINHTRLRLGLSGLNGQRNLFNFIDYSTCPKCGYEAEDSEHFFLFCPSYAAPREAILFSCLDTLYSHELNIIHRNMTTRLRKCTVVKRLLTGDPTLPKMLNIELFKSVHKFIMETHRFL